MESAKRCFGEKYNLKWHSYSNSLVHYLGDHLAQEELVDVTIACEGKYIKAHKLILSACSSYFKELFQIHKVDNPLIILNNVKFEELQYVINFIYHGEIKVLDCDLKGVLLLGSNLKIKGLCNIKEKGLGTKNGDNLIKSSSERFLDENKGTVIKDIVKKIEDDNITMSNKTVQDESLKNTENNINDSIKERPSTSKPIKSTSKSDQLINNESSVKSNINSKITTGISRSTKISSNDKDDVQKPKKRKILTPEKDAQIICPEVPHVLPPVPLPAPVPELEDARNSFLSEDAKNSAKHKHSDSIVPTNDPLSNSTDSGSRLPVRRVSAFMIFAKEWRKRLAVEHPNESNKQISVRLGNMWKNLSEETKDTFYEAASRTYETQKFKLSSNQR